MQAQPTVVPSKRLNREHHKSYDQSTNVHWVYSQGPMKLLKINQKVNHITVSLLRFDLRFNMGNEIQTSVSVWRLPFKLMVFQNYLLIKQLSDEEAVSEDLRSMLSSDAPMHRKFSELMLFRINQVVNSLKKEGGHQYHGLTSITNEVVKGSSFDPMTFLNHPDFRDSNSFMHEIFLNNRALLGVC